MDVIMKYSEQTLQKWTTPLSQTEEQRANNTIKMIKTAINENENECVKEFVK